MKSRDLGAISVAQVRRKKNVWKYFVAVGSVTGALSLSLIIASNRMSISLLANHDSVKSVFYTGMILLPVSVFTYHYAQTAALNAGRPGWVYLIGTLSLGQTILALLFARDILLLDNTLKLSLQTPQWSTFLLCSILLFSLTFTLLLALFSRKGV